MNYEKFAEQTVDELTAALMQGGVDAMITAYANLLEKAHIANIIEVAEYEEWKELSEIVKKQNHLLMVS